MKRALFPMTEQERDDLHAAMAADFAALHRKEEHAPEGSPIVIILVVWGAVLSVGLAWAAGRLL